MIRLLSFLVASALASLAVACLWDSDTLSMEAKEMPRVLDAIVGRFHRNPPLYYEMRLARVARLIEERPEDFNLYDDAAVACDRLGLGDEGLDWLEKKRVALASADPEGKRDQDWYRYYANVGTLRVHRAARDGVTENDLPELEAAIAEIERAIEINPDAHFGREWVQLGLMRSMRAKLAGGDVSRAFMEMVKGRDPKAVLDGLAGLVTLGNAWQSPDVFVAMQSFDLVSHDQAIAAMAEMRAQELLADGGRFIFGETVYKDFVAEMNDHTVGQSKESLAKAYQALRKNADEFHTNRTGFMVARLEAGRHPDDDPSFWEGYVETPRVDVSQFEPFIPVKTWESPWFVFGVAGLVLGGATFGAVKLSKFALKRWRELRRRRAA